MASVVQLWNDWEIQLLVLLSFMLQIFLFFFGCLRRYCTNKLLRLFIWLAYLGADMVAAYALGFLSQLEDPCHRSEAFSGIHQVTFFWAPFLIIHLGGQDTITAFSVEDNSLWSRHLLNLLIQVGLALYVFWKSSGRNQLVAPAVLLFVAGIIKYGERIWALKSASKKGHVSSTNDETSNVSTTKDEDSSHSNFICIALHAMPTVRDLFVGRTLMKMALSKRELFKSVLDRVNWNDSIGTSEHIQLLKIIETELAMMYDDLYTKAMVLSSWGGAILRGVSQISAVVAFVLFHVISKSRYHRADVAITYALFVGTFCLEVCAVFMMIMSPQTWPFLSNMSWHVAISAFWAENMPLWSNSMGQYDFLSSCIYQPRWKPVRWLMNVLDVKKLWINFRHTKHVEAKKEILPALVKWVNQRSDIFFVFRLGCPNLGPAFKELLTHPFEEIILIMHMFTDLHFRRYESNKGGPSNISSDKEISRVMRLCEQISNYMVYLLVVLPSMLPISNAAEDTLVGFSEVMRRGGSTSKQDVLDNLYSGTFDFKWLFWSGNMRRLLDHAESHPFDEMLEEIKETWIRLLLYAAGSCRAELHADQLGKGGQLLTIVWLLLAHLRIGDVGLCRIDLLPVTARTAGGTCYFFEDR